jgi:hypothetical protein
LVVDTMKEKKTTHGFSTRAIGNQLGQHPLEDRMNRRTLLTTIGALSISLMSPAFAATGTGGVLLAQGKSRADSIPKSYMPPAKMCRVWIDGVPAGQQPAPTDCPTAIQKKPANGRVIYGEEKGKPNDKPNDKMPPVKGFTAPPGKTMGHAGAIISGSSGTAEEKMAAFEAAGIGVMRRPADVIALLRKQM